MSTTGLGKYRKDIYHFLEEEGFKLGKNSKRHNELSFLLRSYVNAKNEEILKKLEIVGNQKDIFEKKYNRALEIIGNLKNNQPK